MQTYSIAHAKTHLPKLIHEAEEMREGIHLTRHGKAVAVILSEKEYKRLKQGKSLTPKKALLDFLSRDEFRDVDVDTRVFDQDRSVQQGREIEL